MHFVFIPERLTVSNLRQDMWELIEETQGRIAAEIRVMLGESAIAVTNFTPENQRRRIQAMRDCAATATSDEERHDAWMAMHIEQGWVYGPVFDVPTKTHPNLLPWDQLPSAVKSKARIFDTLSKLGAAMEACFLNDNKAPDAEVESGIPSIPPDLA